MDCLAEGNPIKGFPYGFALQTHKRNAVLIVFHEYSMSAVVLRIERAAAPPFRKPMQLGFLRLNSPLDCLIYLPSF